LRFKDNPGRKEGRDRPQQPAQLRAIERQTAVTIIDHNIPQDGVVLHWWLSGNDGVFSQGKLMGAFVGEGRLYFTREDLTLPERT
jgi:hypothetical protein